MCAYMHHIHIHAPPNTHVHHQIPSKNKIYLVGLPSVLYETPGPNERSVLNQWFCSFSGAFHEKRNERPFARNCNPMFSYVSIDRFTKRYIDKQEKGNYTTKMSI